VAGDVSISAPPADEAFMRLALDEAEKAAADGDVPVGAVAVADGEVIGRQHNRKEALADPTAHAEMLLLREVSERLGRWRLPDVTIYCTMEPCAMCAGALVQARIGRLVYAAPDHRAGAAGSVFDLVRSPALNHRVVVTDGVLAEEARAQLDRFFAGLRQRRQPRTQPVAPAETAEVSADQSGHPRLESGPIG
jgi:tRNA(adenine34) deaminase